jgi:hypothetical protein
MEAVVNVFFSLILLLLLTLLLIKIKNMSESMTRLI